MYTYNESWSLVGVIRLEMDVAQKRETADDFANSQLKK